MKMVSRDQPESNSKPNNSSALPSEYGSVYNIRILTSSEAAVARGASANSRDVYYNTVVGKQAVTHINQDGYSMNLIYRDPYYSGMLAQNATLAVKFAQAQAKVIGLYKLSLIEVELFKYKDNTAQAQAA